MTQHLSPSRDSYHYLHPTPWHTSPQSLFYSPRILSQFKTLTCRISCCVLKFRLFPPYISLAGTMPSEPPKPSRLLSSPRTFLRFLRGKDRGSGRVLCYDKRENYRNAPGHKRRDVDDLVPCVDAARPALEELSLLDQFRRKNAVHCAHLLPDILAVSPVQLPWGGGEWTKTCNLELLRIFSRSFGSRFIFVHIKHLRSPPRLPRIFLFDYSLREVLPPPPNMAKFFRKRSLRARDDQVTNASNLTLRQSIFPLCLVTILFFLWVLPSPRPTGSSDPLRSLLIPYSQGFAYGLLDVLNKHFQNTLGITRSRSSGLQAAYFGWGESWLYLLFGYIVMAYDF